MGVEILTFFITVFGEADDGQTLLEPLWYAVKSTVYAFPFAMISNPLSEISLQ